MIGTVLSGLHGFFHLQLNCSTRLNSLSPFDRLKSRKIYMQGHTTCWCWSQDLNSARGSLTLELYICNYCDRVTYLTESKQQK